MNDGVVGTVSVVMIAQDEAARIGAAIRSCAPFADEVVVVDGGSSDDTVAVCEALGARVVRNPWPGYAAQRALSITEAHGDWVFVLDADEVVGAELAQEIRAVTRRPDPDVDAYELVRVGDFFGHWVGPDRQVRLCRRAQAQITDVAVHERITVPEGRLGVLRGPLWHYGFRSISDHVRRVDHYTDLESETALAAGRRFSLGRLLWRPPAHFGLEYVGRGLFRKGMAGFAVAGFWALYEVLVELKLYERGPGSAAGGHEPPPDAPRR